jgi:hypothetical protein
MPSFVAIRGAVIVCFDVLMFILCLYVFKCLCKFLKFILKTVFTFIEYK